MKDCDISADNKLVTAAHKYCTGNFSACKSSEDSAGSYLYSCAQTAYELTEKAANAAENLDALTQAKNKTDELASGTSRHHVSRVKRQDGLSSCTAVAAAVSSLLIMAAQATTSTLWRSLALTIAAYAGPACSTAEQAALSAQSSSFEVVIVQITVVVSNFKSSVAVSTGTEPTDDELVAALTTAAPSPTTVAPPAPVPVPAPVPAPAPPAPAPPAPAPVPSAPAPSAPAPSAPAPVPAPGPMPTGGVTEDPSTGEEEVELPTVPLGPAPVPAPGPAPPPAPSAPAPAPVPAPPAPSAPAPAPAPPAPLAPAPAPVPAPPAPSAPA